MTRDAPLSRRRYLAGAAALFAGCSSGGPKLMGQPTRTAPADQPERTLAFGESLDLPDVRVTVDAPRLEAVQAWTEDDRRRTARAGEDRRWLFVRLASRNTADEPTALPQTLRFEARIGDVLYKPGRTHDRSRKYVGGRVPAGERRAGDVGYLVPASVTAEDVAVRYEETRGGDRYRARWG